MGPAKERRGPLNERKGQLHPCELMHGPHLFHILPAVFVFFFSLNCFKIDIYLLFSIEVKFT